MNSYDLFVTPTWAATRAPCNTIHPRLRPHGPVSEEDYFIVLGATFDELFATQPNLRDTNNQDVLLSVFTEPLQ